MAAQPQPKLPGTPQPEPDRCGAELNKSMTKYGELRYCGQAKGHGTTHVGYGNCKLHAGSTPNNVLAAQRQMVDDEARSILERMGQATPIREPVIELLALAAEVMEWKKVCTEKVSELQTFDYFDKAGVQRARALVELFERAVDRSLTTLVQIEKLGLQRRAIELQEAQGLLIGNLILSVLQAHELGLSDDQLSVAAQLAAIRLAELGPQLRPEEFAILSPRGEIIDAEVVEEE